MRACAQGVGAIAHTQKRLLAGLAYEERGSQRGSQYYWLPRRAGAGSQSASVNIGKRKSRATQQAGARPKALQQERIKEHIRERGGFSEAWKGCGLAAMCFGLAVLSGCFALERRPFVLPLGSGAKRLPNGSTKGRGSAPARHERDKRECGNSGSRETPRLPPNQKAPATKPRPLGCIPKIGGLQRARQSLGNMQPPRWREAPTPLMCSPLHAARLLGKRQPTKTRARQGRNRSPKAPATLRGRAKRGEGEAGAGTPRAHDRWAGTQRESPRKTGTGAMRTNHAATKHIQRAVAQDRQSRRAILGGAAATTRPKDQEPSQRKDRRKERPRHPAGSAFRLRSANAGRRGAPRTPKGTTTAITN